MSKVNRELLNNAVRDILAFSNGESIKHPDPKAVERLTEEGKMGEDGMIQGKKRNFVETIELQIALKNYDPARDKRFSGQMKLPVPPKSKLKVCMLGNAVHVEAAGKIGMDAMSEDDLKKLNKNKKLVKKLAAKYDFFLASSNLIKKIPRLLGPGLNRAGKFPTVIANSESIEAKVAELGSTIKFQMKKVLCINVAVANVAMSEEQIQHNILISSNFLVSLLKKQWQNIKVLYIKSTMGPRFQIYF